MPANTAEERDLAFKRYTALCRGLDHEANVMNHRITWAILYSAGLFAASAILINVLVQVNQLTNLGKSAVLVMMLGTALTGLIFSWRSREGVLAAQGQFDDLAVFYKEHYPDFKAMELPRPFGNPNNHERGHAAASIFPIMMIVAWGSALALEATTILLLLSPWIGDIFSLLAVQPPSP